MKAQRSSSDGQEGTAGRWDDDELRRVYSAVRAVARRFETPDIDMADLVQECMVRVVGGANQCAEWPLPRTWVIEVAKNGCINYVVSERRHGCERSVGDSDLEQMPDDEPLPDQVCEVGQRRDAVQDALADLPPVQREALRAVFLEGRSCREAAEFLGVSKSTVHRAVREGIARLKASGKLAAWVNESVRPPKRG